MANPNSKINFILQQGLSAPPPESCSSTYTGLLFQGEVIAIVTVVATIARSASMFLGLAALLWWSAAFPRANPFDMVHNRLFCTQIRVSAATCAGPSTFCATAALAFGGFCVGSYLYHVLTGRRHFANCTLPWSTPPDAAGGADANSVT